MRRAVPTGHGAGSGSVTLSRSVVTPGLRCEVGQCDVRCPLVTVQAASLSLLKHCRRIILQRNILYIPEEGCTPGENPEMPSEGDGGEEKGADLQEDLINTVM
ncbi:hypothetical protein NDU88_005493 [Pleurodeles waltl]|uniref:Uncharacterized protein n=1 Tax=Pleurodeles waltl TaxID=8319 RepID=A0AAV7QEW4_PLEWA|nr:hypothetical protein NDU88_005493 [Pleurodeles waltl]